ncbi:MAG: hypothetical protein K2H43_03960, partial [Clostridia bacterium]|nr:hypothetical protein [Clostridia bacterium]
MSASNYKLVQTEKSRFEIQKRKISVRLGAAGTGSKTYDGEAYLFPNDNYTLTNGTSFAPGETLTIGVAYYDVTRGRAVEAPVNAGTYRISLDPETCYINGEIKATLNYELECADTVSYEIAKRGFTAELENAEKTYDGTVYGYGQDGKKILISGILDGDIFSGGVYYTLGGTKTDPVFADTYSICLAEDEWKILSGSRDVSENYALESVTEAQLVIEKREVRVSVFFAGSEDSAKLLREYSGEAIFVPERSYVSESAYGEGFVAREGIRDDLRVQPVYTYLQYGAEVTPIEKGTYAVNVAFTDADLLHNYELSYDSGVLEIITRCVTVKADTSVYAGIEYNGGGLDLSVLDYLDYHKGNSAEIGFLNADDRSHYTVSYRIFCGGEQYDPKETLQAGDYTVTVTLTPKSGFDDGYVIDCEEAYFTVAPRPVLLKAHDLSAVYSKQIIDIALHGYTHTYAGEGGGAGFVGTDEDLAVAEYSYYVDMVAVTPIDAGEYQIFVSVTDGSGYLFRNYSFTAESGTLTIEKRKIIIVPEKYEELYVSSSQVISLPETNWLAEQGELADGDILRVQGDSVLRASQGKSIKVGIAAISITDSATGENMAKNYDAIYRYTADCGVRESKFSVKLSFTARKVEVRQKTPPQSVIPYTGQSVDIPFRGNGEELFELVAGSGDGLLAGHSLYVVAANTGNTPGIVSKWLKRMGVLDERGRDVSEFYDVSIGYDESTQIVLQAIPVTVTVYADIALYEEGAELTDPQLFEVSGRLLTGHVVRVFVENGTFAAHVYESGIDKQRDKY